MPSVAHLLSYPELRKHLRAHVIRQSQIPGGHITSLPLPSLRWGRPAYAVFASPKSRNPDEDVKQGAPDRWLVLDARHGELLLYALWSVQSYAQNIQWKTVILPPVTSSLDQERERLASIEMLIDELALSFFSQQPANQGTRRALNELLLAHIPGAILPQYRALVPDFWAWLEA